MKDQSQRDREQELFECMKRYYDSNYADPQRYILEIGNIYAKRTQDQQEILALLDKYDETINIEILHAPPHRVSGATYITDSNELQNMREDINDETKCDAAWEYIANSPEMSDKTRKRRINVPERLHESAPFYNGNVDNLLNAVIALKSKKQWTFACIAYVEDNSVFVFLNNDKFKWTIIEDFNRSIIENHVKLL